MSLLEKAANALNTLVAKRKEKIVAPKSDNRKAVDQLLGSAKNIILNAGKTVAETSPASVYRVGKSLAAKASDAITDKAAVLVFKSVEKKINASLDADAGKSSSPAM